jgi:ribonuclease T2
MISRIICALPVIAAVVSFASPAVADVALTGTFIAGKECPAFQSFRKATNPGNVKTESGRSYPLLAKNAPQASHYRIKVEGANPDQRWVSVDCGNAQGGDQPSQASIAPKGGVAPAQLILSLSWEPGFCQGRTEKPECAPGDAGSFQASHLTLHGLWPQPRGKEYCNVSPAEVSADKKHDWEALPDVPLDADTRQQLDRVMPGTQSHLERHEWIRHGTCYYGADANSYFHEAVALADEVNNSAVQAAFASHIGREISADDVRTAFTQAFGEGAGDRVKLSCTRDGSRRLLTEITIGLSGRPKDGMNLGDLVSTVRPTDPGCPSGILATPQ